MFILRNIQSLSLSLVMRVRLSITVDSYYNQLSRAHKTYTENGAPLYLIILDDKKLASMPSDAFVDQLRAERRQFVRTFKIDGMLSSKN